MTDEAEMLALLQSDIAERLRPVCMSMPERDFEELVREIAAVKLKYGVDSDVSSSLRSRLQPVMPGSRNSSSPVSS